MKLSIIVLTKNEEKWLPGCLESASHLADEIIVVDDQSTDKTREVAKKYGAKVFVHQKRDFAAQREFGLRQVRADWVFYLDADERVTKELRKEIVAITGRPLRESRQATLPESSPVSLSPVAYYIKRKNIFLGREQTIDKVERLFKRKALMSWQGRLHESPKVKGSKETLNNHLIHLTHRDINSMLVKTMEWSKIEADLRYQAGHPPITWRHLLSAILREKKRQFLINRVYRYGTEGWLEGIFQIFSTFITYARLWEKQRKEPLEVTYEKIDQKFRC